MSKEAFKTRIGGQAVMEGISMRGPEKTCLAVRLPDGTIHTELSDSPKNPLRKIPILRGAAAMVISLWHGYTYLMKSADLAFPEEAEKEKEKGSSLFSGPLIAVLSGVLAIGIFVLLPTFLTGLIDRFATLGYWKTVVEGALKVIIFIGYLFGVSRIKDIRRVFEYHGAEHKTIACYEHREELTVANIRKYTRFHPRCGTSFIFIVLIISIIVFSFVPWTSTGMRALLKLVCLPFVMGLAYEVIQFAGSHDGWFCAALSAPGKWVQRLTVFEPDDSMIEVAIESMKPAIPENEDDARW